MLYDKYARKAQRINKALNAIYRMRFFLIGLAAVTTTSVLTYEGFVGKVEMDQTDALTFVYGNPIHFSSTAFNNSSSVEYSKKGENSWSGNTPCYPGEYEVRGVSKNGYGIATYSDALSFTITKRDASIYINENQITYGYKPTIKSATLFGEDHFNDDYFVSYEYDETYLNPTAKVDVDTIKVLDKYDNDITFCYNLTAIDKQIQIRKRPVTINFATKSKIYDGTAYSFDDGSVDENTPLVEGDEVVFGDTEISADDLTKYNAGIYSNVQYTKDVKIMHGDENVSVFYQITKNFGSYSVAPINLSISGAGYIGVYNGKTLFENGAFAPVTFSIEPEKDLFGLSREDGKHKLVATYDNQSEYNDFVKTCEFTNSFTYDIIDKDTSESVLQYYSIPTPEYKTVKVSKLDATVTFENGEFVYDGTSKTVIDYTTDGILECDAEVIKTEYVPSLINTTYTNNVLTPVTNEVDLSNEEHSDFVKIHKKSDTTVDVTDCYNISYNFGTISIEKRKVTVDFLPIGDNNETSITYDGEYHSVDKFDYEIDTTSSIDVSRFDFKLKYQEAFEKNHNSNIKSTNEVVILDKDNGSIDVTSCFDITYGERPTSKILKREITATLYFDNIETQNEVTYDGNEHTIKVTLENNDGISTALATTDTASFKDSSNNRVNSIDKKLYVEGGYSLTNLGFDIQALKDGSTTEYESVLDNYTITEHDVMINKKEIEIILPVEDFTYDGSKHEVHYTDHEIDTTGDYVREKTSGSVTNVGDTYLYTKDNLEIDNKDCYTITYKYPDNTTNNNSTVKPLAIDFVYTGYEGVYDGKSHDVTCALSPSSNPLPTGYHLAKTKFPVKNVKTYSDDDKESAFAIEILDGDNKSVSLDNFTITTNIDEIKVKITKYPIKVTYELPNTNPVYDGTEKTFNGYSATGLNDEPLTTSNMPDGELLKITQFFSATNAGDYSWSSIAQKPVISIVDAATEKTINGWENNYDITTSAWEKATIEKRVITVNVKDYEPTYNGRTFRDNFSTSLITAKNNKSGYPFEVFDGGNDVTSTWLDDQDLDLVITYKNDTTTFEKEKSMKDLISLDITNVATASNYKLSVTYGECTFQKFEAYLEFLKFYDTYGNNTSKTEKTMESICSISQKGTAKTNLETTFWNYHTLKFDEGTSYGTHYTFNGGITAGSYDITAIKDSFQIWTTGASGSEISTDRYNLNFKGVEKAYNVNKRSLKIRLKSESFEYSGDPIKIEFIITAGTSLADGDSLYLHKSNTEEMVIDNSLSYNNLLEEMVERDSYILTFKNSNTYITKSSFIIKNGSNTDVTSSYNIDFEYDWVNVE